MCGEKPADLPEEDLQKGSPPHVRGKGTRNGKIIAVTGITPACAGKRPTRSISCQLCRDHPRMCGEKLLRKSPSLRNKGSPPHVRGKEASVIPQSNQNGITPACAGKRSSVRWSALLAWDHPRMCGEKTPGALAGAAALGSPPHVRGKD